MVHKYSCLLEVAIYENLYASCSNQLPYRLVSHIEQCFASNWFGCMSHRAQHSFRFDITLFVLRLKCVNLQCASSHSERYGKNMLFVDLWFELNEIMRHCLRTTSRKYSICMTTDVWFGRDVYEECMRKGWKGSNEKIRVCKIIEILIFFFSNRNLLRFYLNAHANDTWTD